MLMIRMFRWWFGFIVGTLLLLWSIFFMSVLSHYLSLGPALGLFFLTEGTFILMALLMLLFVFFHQTRPISFGLVVPLLALQIWLFIYAFNSWVTLVNLPVWIMLLVVGITYWHNVRHPSSQLSTIK